MNERLIEIHNSYVKPQDKWYFLGDLTMDRGNDLTHLLLVDKLNGHKRMIPGNHDHWPVEVYLKVFEKVMAMQFLDNIRFTHIPIHPESIGGAIANVHGHTHDKPNYPPHVWTNDKGHTFVKPYVNISLERTNYRPVTFGEVKELINKEVLDWKESIEQAHTI
jgi:calcineurin-like phosphoesterase family protein